MESLLKTSDYRSIIRVLNEISYNLMDVLPKPYIEELIIMIENKNLGRAVEETLKEFKEARVA